MPPSTKLFSPGNWETLMRIARGEGYPRLPQERDILNLLKMYHATLGPDVEARVQVLEALNTLCQEAWKATKKVDQGRLFFDLGTQVEKEMFNIDRAQMGWGKLRRVFAPSRTEGGVETRSIQHLGFGMDAADFQAQDVPQSRWNYWLEVLDPKHRSWGHVMKYYFDHWMADKNTDKNFFDWVDSRADITDPELLKSVAYLAPDQRWKYWISFARGRMQTARNCHKVLGRFVGHLEPFDTSGMQTVVSGPGAAIWVCSPSGIFYSGDHVLSEFHHSSFLAGGRVIAAGEWIVENGRLLVITSKTGHYAATPRNLRNALLQLAAGGRVDFHFSGTMVIVVGADGKGTLYRAHDWLTNQATAQALGAGRLQSLMGTAKANARAGAYANPPKPAGAASGYDVAPLRR